MANLTYSDIVGIESKAKDVLVSVFGDIENLSLPIDISRILSQYSLTIKQGKFKNTSIVGIYNRPASTIYVSEGDSYQRKAFTVAHELGHHFLHEDKTEEIFLRTQLIKLDNEQTKQEAQANWFAASILMPENLIKKYWNLTKDIDKLSTIFGVSQTAVFFRLKNLGLI